MEPMVGRRRAGAARRAQRRALLAASLVLSACGDESATTAPIAGPEPLTLLVLDQDAGAPLPDGGRAGAILQSVQATSGWSEPAVVATDPRWLEPTDLLQLPDGSWLLL